LETKDSSIINMVKKLSNKQLMLYVKYQGVMLVGKGRDCSECISYRCQWQTDVVNNPAAQKVTWV